VDSVESSLCLVCALHNIPTYRCLGETTAFKMLVFLILLSESSDNAKKKRDGVVIS